MFINATIITELVLESGPVLAGPTGPVPPALIKSDLEITVQLSNSQIVIQGEVWYDFDHHVYNYIQKSEILSLYVAILSKSLVCYSCIE